MKRQTKASAKPAASKAAPPKPSSASARSTKNTDSTDELDKQLVHLLARRVAAMRDELQQLQSHGQRLELWRYQERATQQAALWARELDLDPVRTAEWIKHIVSFCFEQTHVSEPIAYLGPMYSYSYLAAAKHFGISAPLVPVATIAAVFDELVRGQATYGAAPI